MYRSYKHHVYINGIWFHYVVVDDHVHQRHGESINDELVLKLVNQLHRHRHFPESTDANGFEYYNSAQIAYEGKSYKMIWLIPPDKSFIGIRTAFRRKKYDPQKI